MRKRKYPKVTGSWTYGHIVVPEKLIYIGSSDRPECKLRWHPSGYKETELQPYIEKHGWDNIKHIVFKDGLTPKQAKQLEDLLITQAKIDGWCINKQGSGWERKDNRKEYYRKYYKTHKKTEKIIYTRVHNYNRNHTPIETPLEAKQKYLETGYIPNYIKNNDLI